MINKFTKPSAIIFDLDDTLIDYGGAVHECWHIICERYAPQLDKCTTLEITEAIKQQAEWYWSDTERHRIGRLDMNLARIDIISAVFQQFGLTNSELITTMALEYNKEREERYRLYPESIDVLERLKEMGIILGMITNGHSSMQRKKIERFSLEPYFQTILVESEFGAGKPDERVYKHMIGVLDLPPNKIWMVGDNLSWDVLGPQKLGITGVWHNRNNNSLPDEVQNKPDFIIKDLREIFALIGKI